MTLRLESLAARSPACGPVSGLHNSQVLSHQPVDPDDPDATNPRWPGQTTLRLAVRRKCGPFVSRAPFEPADVTALTVADEGRLGATGWQVVDGAVSVLGTPTPGLRHYAVLGDTGWDHLRITAELDPSGGAAGVAVAVAGLPRVERAMLAVVDEAARELQLFERRGGLTQQVNAVPLPADAAAPYALEVDAFDDLLRARLGETVVEAPRGDLRDGRLALVLDGPGRCVALHVESLEAYASQVTTSRYAGFDEHIASWDGVVHPSPGQPAAVPALLAATGADLAAAMTPEADPQARQRLFDRWVADASIPISPAVPGIRLAAVDDPAGTRLLLLESPEPLPFSNDVTVTLTHRVLGLPGPPPVGVPRALLRFAAGLVFARDGVSGAVSDDVLGLVGQARRLVHAVRSTPQSRTVYQIYEVRVRTISDGSVLTGDLVEVRPTPPLTPTFPPRQPRFPVDHVGLIDGDGELLGVPLPLPVERDEEVPLTLISNSVEDRVLLIPQSPLVPDTYTVTFRLDRQRYRVAAPDDDSRYRASAVLRVAV